MGARGVRHPRRLATARRQRDLSSRAPPALFRAGCRVHRRGEGARPSGRGTDRRAAGHRFRAREALPRGALDLTVSLKEDALVLVTEDDGGLPLGASSPLGLYYHDTQYLSGYGLRVNGTRPILLSANTEQNYVATFQLMHSEGATLGTARHAAETLSIRRTRFLADGLRERVGVLNANAHPVDIRVELEFEAAFRDGGTACAERPRSPSAPRRTRSRATSSRSRARSARSRSCSSSSRSSHARTAPVPRRRPIVSTTPSTPSMRDTADSYGHARCTPRAPRHSMRG
ncbi:MAG: hypothetical protein E6J09_13805 [Chloroflexi bacterium]|nr:MAG: hypothetical protein E6J09_13805 [Chloroflexota bacterium]